MVVSVSSLSLFAAFFFLFFLLDDVAAPGSTGVSLFSSFFSSSTISGLVSSTGYFSSTFSASCSFGGASTTSAGLGSSYFTSSFLVSTAGV